jgi:hypothetical protein
MRNRTKTHTGRPRTNYGGGWKPAGELHPGAKLTEPAVRAILLTLRGTDLRNRARTRRQSAGAGRALRRFDPLHGPGGRPDDGPG